jgi:c-di-GMP-binding flagellar brake protein YcgR
VNNKSICALYNTQVGEMLEEKRAHYRLQIHLPVLYKVSNPKATTIKKVTTYDISDSGICFYTGTLHKKGTKLQVTLPHIFDSPRICTVKWHSKKYDDRYKIGVHFQRNIF